VPPIFILPFSSSSIVLFAVLAISPILFFILLSTYVSVLFTLLFFFVGTIRFYATFGPIPIPTRIFACMFFLACFWLVNLLTNFMIILLGYLRLFGNFFLQRCGEQYLHFYRMR